MKKFLAGIAAAAIITVPMTSFALESMSKGALKKATGQAGVSIALDNVVIVQKSMPTTTYWDNDGLSSINGNIGRVESAGVQISYLAGDSQKLIILDGITDATKYGTADLESTFKISERAGFTGIAQVGVAEADAMTIDLNPAVAGTQNGIDPTNGDSLAAGPVMIDDDNDAATPMVEVAGRNFRTGISPLSIDIGTCQSLTAGLSYNLTGSNTAGPYDVAGVVIGLPTLEITTYHTNDVKIISVVTDAASHDATANSGSTVTNVSNELIRIEKAGVSQMAILGGRLEIAPH